MMTAKQKYRSTEKGKSTERSYNLKMKYAAQKKWAKSANGKRYEKLKNVKSAEYRKEWLRAKYKSDPDFRKKVLARSKKFRNSENGRKYHKHAALMQSFGISIDQYQSLLKRQDNKCACCFVDQSLLSKKLHVDHCHKNGSIRGLLCYKCNIGIGMLGDNIEGIVLALNYLNKTVQMPIKASNF